jgi:hypothetical protein
MTDLRGLSRLPDDPEYWSALEERVLDGLRANAGSARAGWWAPVAARAWGLGGLALAAGLAAVLLVPGRTTESPAIPATLLGLPDQPAVAAIIAAPQPPSIASLVAPALARSP